MEWISLVAEYSSWGAYGITVIILGWVIRDKDKIIKEKTEENVAIRKEAREDRGKTNIILEKLNDFLIEIKTKLE